MAEQCQEGINGHFTFHFFLPSYCPILMMCSISIGKNGENIQQKANAHKANAGNGSRKIISFVNVFEWIWNIFDEIL